MLAMVAKPTGDDVALILVVAAILVVLIAVFVAPPRKLQAQG